MVADFLTSGDFWIKAIGLMTAVVSLLATYLTYRKSRREDVFPAQAAAIVGSAGSLKVSFDLGPQSPFWWRFMKIVNVIMGVSGIVLSAAAVYYWINFDDMEVHATIFFVEGAVMSGASVFLLTKLRGRREDAKSKVYREMTINVEGEFDPLFLKCRRALEKITPSLDVVDVTHGRLEGKTKISMRSFGEQVSIQISEQTPKHYFVLIKSDCVVPTTLIDYGKNVSNIRKIVRELMN